MFLYISVQLSFFFAFCSPPSASRHLRLREGRSLASFIFAKLLKISPIAKLKSYWLALLKISPIAKLKSHWIALLKSLLFCYSLKNLKMLYQSIFSLAVWLPCSMATRYQAAAFWSSRFVPLPFSYMRATFSAASGCPL